MYLTCTSLACLYLLITGKALSLTHKTSKDASPADDFQYPAPSPNSLMGVLRESRGGVTLQQLNYTQHSLLRSVLRCLSHVDIHLVEAIEVRDLLDLPGGYDGKTPVKAIQFGPVDAKSHMGVLKALIHELHERAEDVKTHVTCIQVRHTWQAHQTYPRCSDPPVMTHLPYPMCSNEPQDGSAIHSPGKLNNNPCPCSLCHIFFYPPAIEAPRHIHMCYTHTVIHKPHVYQGHGAVCVCVCVCVCVWRGGGRNNPLLHLDGGPGGSPCRCPTRNGAKAAKPWWCA